MAKKASGEKIVQALRQAEVFQDQGRLVSEACRKLAISEQSFYRWKKEHGTLKLDQAKRLCELESPKTGGGFKPGLCDFEGSSPGKLTSPAKWKEAVVCGDLAFPERASCLLGP